MRDEKWILSAYERGAELFCSQLLIPADCLTNFSTDEQSSYFMSPNVRARPVRIVVFREARESIS